MTEPENNTDKILLESGTNEVEILEFVTAGDIYGVNVAKVRQLIPYVENDLRRVPLGPSAVVGLYPFRSSTIPVIDLAGALSIPAKGQPKKRLVMICEFNRLVNGFLIDEAHRIYRISWEKIKPADEAIRGTSSCITGSVSIEERLIPIVDLESLILSVNPELIRTGEPSQAEPEKAACKTCRILVAEDSDFLRKQIVKKLKSSGFINVDDFADGKKAHDAILEYRERSRKEVLPVHTYFQAVVTDIEMPQMDGLTLCRRIKEDPCLKEIPVVVYSSLINEEMAQKCRSVGANAHVSKPDMEALARTLHELLDKKQ